MHTINTPRAHANSFQRPLVAFCAAFILLAVAGCPDGDAPEDAGVEPEADAGDNQTDAGTAGRDGGHDAGPNIPEQDQAWRNADSTAGAPSAQWAHIVADLGDHRALVFGGNDLGDFGGGIYDETYIYDARDGVPTLTLVDAQRRPEPRYCGCAAYDPTRDEVLLYGGRDFTDLFMVAWRFDMSTETWTELGPGPAGMLGCSLTYHAGDDAFYLFAGANGQATLNDIVRFDPEDDTWTDIESQSLNSPSNRYDAELFARGDTLIAVGGAASAASGFRSDVWSFDVNTAQWRELAPDGPPGRRVPWVRVAPDESGFYMGFGTFEQTPLGDLWFFDFETNTYREVVLDPAPSARGFSQALPGGPGVIGTVLYGFDMQNPSEGIWELLADSDEPMWWP